MRGKEVVLRREGAARRRERRRGAVGSSGSSVCRSRAYEVQPFSSIFSFLPLSTDWLPSAAPSAVFCERGSRHQLTTTELVDAGELFRVSRRTVVGKGALQGVYELD